MVRLDSLTGLRFVAALAVFFTHAAISGQEGLFGQGRIGVEFFFVLSGFVLTWARDDETSAATFLRRRFARIFPAYIVAWIAGYFVSLHVGTGHPSIGRLGAGGLLLQTWIPIESWYFAINGPSWSLSAEAFFYLSFPLWAAALTAASVRQRRVVLAACVIGVVAVALVAQVGYSGHEYVYQPGGNAWDWFVREFPPVRLLEFVAGSAIALEVRDRSIPRIPLWPAFGLVGIAYAICGVWRSYFTSSAVALVPFLILIAAAAQADLAGERTVFARRWFVWLGAVSFCFYLVHQLVIRLAANHYGSNVTIPIVVGELVVSILAAAALHYVIEKPFERRIRGSNSRVVAGA